MVTGTMSKSGLSQSITSSASEIAAAVAGIPVVLTVHFDRGGQNPHIQGWLSLNFSAARLSA